MPAKHKTRSVSQRVGLDIGSHSVKGVEVVERGSEMVIRSACAVPIPGVKAKSDPRDHGSVVQAIKTTPGTRLMENGVMVGSHQNREVRIPCENVAGRLAREMQRSLRFFTSQYAEGSYLGMIGSATMGGGGALLKGLDLCLEQQGIEITGIVNPFAGFSVDAEAGLQQIGDTAPQFATAMGLAIGDYWASAPAQMEIEFAA